MTWRGPLRGLALVAVLAALQGHGGCNAGSRTNGSSPQNPGSPQPPPPPPSAEPTVVTGSERIAWSQEVDAGTRVGSMSFAAYVDGARVAFPGVSCTAQSPTFHECSAPLPQMTPLEGRFTEGPSIDGKGEFTLRPAEPHGREPSLAPPDPRGGAQTEQLTGVAAGGHARAERKRGARAR